MESQRAKTRRGLVHDSRDGGHAQQVSVGIAATSSAHALTLKPLTESFSIDGMKLTQGRLQQSYDSGVILMLWKPLSELDVAMFIST
jgi:hypothetical protein